MNDPQVNLNMLKILLRSFRGHRGQKVIRIQKIFKKSYLLGAIYHVDVIWSDERSFTSVASVDTDMGSKVI